MAFAPFYARSRLTFSPSDGVVKTTTTFIWLAFLIDRLGRRPLFLIGAAGAAFSMFYIGIVIRVTHPSAEQTSITASGKSAVAFLYIWSVFYGPTWNGTPWVVCAEVFPQHVRALAQALLSFSQWVSFAESLLPNIFRDGPADSTLLQIWQFVIARATPYMFRDMQA